MEPTDAAKARLSRLRARTEGAAPWSEAALLAEAQALARELLDAAERERLPSEAKAEARLQRLMADEAGRLFTLAMTDQALRAKRPARVADQLRHLLEVHGIPRYFSAWERLQLRAFKAVGGLAPGWLVPKVLARLRREVRQVTLPAEDPALGLALSERRAAGLKVNVNHLGEAILGEDEARARHAAYLRTLARDDLDSVSVKVSSIASQIQMLGWDATLAVLRERVGALYEAAVRGAKRVTLDMEEYRDLELTVALFTSLLSEPRFRDLRAGIVLQAYLPDSHAVQRRLVAFARERVAQGGAPIRLRIVKGANLAMEKVDASLHGWAQAPYTSKAEVDANYKRMVDYALEPAHAAVCEVGIASHNLFDLAWALVLRAARGVEAKVGFEMLFGIAAPLCRVMAKVSGDVMIYAPTATDDDLLAAIAYLIRRLDENTGPDNYLRASFGMRAGSDAFAAEEARFLRSVEARERPLVGSRRADSTIGHGLRCARAQSKPGLAPLAALSPFENEPDTDWSLPANRAWIAQHLDAVRALAPHVVPAQVGGELVSVDRDSALAGPDHDGGAIAAPDVIETLNSSRGQDPTSRGVAGGQDPSTSRVLYHAVQVGLDDVDRALQVARAAAPGWAATAPAERVRLLGEAAERLRDARGHLTAVMVADAGKHVAEGDSEVSEAIDFAEYYRRGIAALDAPSLEVRPRGVVLVTPPWNFPLAIPAGGVFAALAAGNVVLLKPAPETPWVAFELATLCWQAGIPREVLQLVPCVNDPVGSALVSDPRVDAVILTGGTSTARRFQAMRPGLPLFAETGGKNAMIVSEMADWDLAIKNALHGAFGHAGQKCSATSLLILEAALYDDPRFLDRLSDATRSLHVGSAWDLAAKVTPLIREPRGDLAWNLEGGLEPGESWLVAPRRDSENPRLWSPGVKLGVRPGSRTYTNELFGPVLGVMRATDLDDAIRLANGVAYGLTAGLVSLDDREIARWLSTIDAGCLYVNRGTTGAIVRRQPFGGVKQSVFGPGAKAGGPNYLYQLVTCQDREADGPDDYAAAFEAHFARPEDPSHVLGQDNTLRYRPARVALRIAAGATALELRRVKAALTVVARASSTSIEISWAPELAQAAWPATLEPALRPTRYESAAALAARLGTLDIERLRVLGALEPELQPAAQAAHIHVEASPVVASGRVELLRYLREETVSYDYHRFGNLGPREA